MILTVNGIDLDWQETGDGEPLLFLHGGMGHGADWRHIFGEPPAGYRVVAPDLRGHGHTPTRRARSRFGSARTTCSPCCGISG
jgi:pimeloyl-ACP methyl ester carboxylesterase